ncbi:MAG TPA: hypothetical protein DCY42_08715 [Chloroflexi bacterium]|nr:hypothetical protein [Chloroflexota bacterium]
MPDSEKLPVAVISCKVFEGLIDQFLPSDFAEQITFLDYGLHRVPSKLTFTVQNAIDELETPSLIILGYGLCGNGLDGIKAGHHTLLIPRTDDCIAILLGSYPRYMQEFTSQPGTYYLTKGWLESGSNPLQEYHEIREKYGPKDAEWIMDAQYQNYKRLAFIAHQEADLFKYRPTAKEVAAYCERWGMVYEEILGSENYVRRLVEIALNLDKLDSEFLVIPPGGTLTQEAFLR